MLCCHNPTVATLFFILFSKCCIIKSNGKTHKPHQSSRRMCRDETWPLGMPTVSFCRYGVHYDHFHDRNLFSCFKFH